MEHIYKNTKYHRLNHEEIVNDYERLKSLNKVGLIHGVTGAVIKKSLISSGVALPAKFSINDLDHVKIIKRYNETHNARVVAKELGTTPSNIQKILHKHNIPISRINYTDHEIIQKYLKIKTLNSTCAELKISEGTLRNVLRKHNIELQTLKRYKIGDVIGKLTIIKEIEPKIENNDKKRKRFILKCECGGTKIVSSNALSKSGGAVDCGCSAQKSKLEREFKAEEKKKIVEQNRINRLIKQEEIKQNKLKKNPRKIYFAGMVKDMLTILSISDDHYTNRTIICKCKCGNIKKMSIRNFYKVKSCGCLQTENKIKASTTHGYTSRVDLDRRKWYDRWKGMMARCNNPKMHAYHNYGGRGIRVCDRWSEPNGVGCENYYNDIHNILGPQPGPNYSLDRIDNNGMYEITNLRWATLSQQSKNQRRFENP